MVTTNELHQFARQASAITWPFTALSTLIFAMRTSSRLCFNKYGLAWEDLIITLSWGLNIIRAAAMQKSVDAYQVVELTNLPESVPAASFWAVFVDSWAFFSIGIPKLGIAFLTCRILRPPRWLQTSVISFCIVLNVLATVGFILCFVQCSPVAGQFNPWKYPHVKCWDQRVQLDYACAVSSLSALTDILFSVWPGFIIWNLQMPTWKRVSAMGLMSIGIASCIFAFIKLYSNTTLFGVSDPIVELDRALRIALWNRVENEFVLTAACLPAAPPIIRACSRALRRSGLSTSPSNMYGYSRKPKVPGPYSDITTVELVTNAQKPGRWNSTGEGNGSSVSEGFK
ncbi:uncharacterized protein BO66DRAFT_438443 [Aspergillus aculeatinus CBS 121060]|uniref:Uncharacterized protein n=1 Tax=Aspergillus aculeatinus CBS 121060 TaxID=1448322 RepID=A0ACD1H921_9EURO|nr:hypothetical protein BO66DRAFT_438443 [Aspergillus aculeatinus CBS 121060]RAH70082.1 hypothetical protein BO66DRAFT_438443 [Aspergillus aculeatinus CBS 121060]